MIKKYKEFIIERVEADITPKDSTDNISTEDFVRQMSDQLGIDISNFDMDDICSNMDIDGLSTNERKKAIFNYLMKINENK